MPAERRSWIDVFSDGQFGERYGREHKAVYVFMIFVHAIYNIHNSIRCGKRRIRRPLEASLAIQAFMVQAGINPLVKLGMRGAAGPAGAEGLGANHSARERLGALVTPSVS